MTRDIETAYLWLAMFNALHDFGREVPVETDNKVLQAIGGPRKGIDINERMDLADEMFKRAIKAERGVTGA